MDPVVPSLLPFHLTLRHLPPLKIKRLRNTQCIRAKTKQINITLEVHETTITTFFDQPLIIIDNRNVEHKRITCKFCFPLSLDFFVFLLSLQDFYLVC